MSECLCLQGKPCACPCHHADAAAVPVPDAGNDMLREQLVEGIKELLPVDPDDGTVVSEFGDFGPIWDNADEVSRGYADALLPLIREHIAAAVQGEREQLAQNLLERAPSPGDAYHKGEFASGVRSGLVNAADIIRNGGDR